MKLLSISCAFRHDLNISYFDGKTVKYIKMERNKQQKRFHYDKNKVSFLEKDLYNLWGISFADMDDAVVVYGNNKHNQHMLWDKNHTYPIYTSFENYDTIFSNLKKGWFVDHHYLHSLSVDFFSEKPADVSIIIDHDGQGRPFSVMKGDELIEYTIFENGSIGRNKEKLGIFLGMNNTRPGDYAGKIMALQSYGNIDENYLDILRQYNMYNIDAIYNYKEWIKYKRNESSILDWLRTIHERVGEVIVETFSKYVNEDDHVSYSGGVAQNVIWNTLLKKKFKNLKIIPHSGDEGLSFGGLEFLRKIYNLPKFDVKNFPYIQSDVSPKDYASDDTIKQVAKLLSEGKTVAWYQGHGEVGPRALGNRSILMNPTISNGKEIINKIKNRENYRPFGASVLKEYQNEYFDLGWDDDYMLYTANVKTDIFPAITHIDGTCRLQTVGYKNPIFRKLIEEFNKLTGIPVLLNTSLNINGKPIAGYPENAIQLLRDSTLDCAVIGNQIYMKGP